MKNAKKKRAKRKRRKFGRLINARLVMDRLNQCTVKDCVDRPRHVLYIVKEAVKLIQYTYEKVD